MSAEAERIRDEGVRKCAAYLAEAARLEADARAPRKWWRRKPDWRWNFIMADHYRDIARVRREDYLDHMAWLLAMEADDLTEPDFSLLWSRARAQAEAMS